MVKDDKSATLLTIDDRIIARLVKVSVHLYHVDRLTTYGVIKKIHILPISKITLNNNMPNKTGRE